MRAANAVMAILGLAAVSLGAFAMLETREAHAAGLGGPGLRSGGTPVTGATISPSTITLSGSAPQVTCSGTGVCEIDSAAADATTSTTVPAFRLKATTNIGDTDLLFAIVNSADSRVFFVDEGGATTFIGTLTEGSGGPGRIVSLASDASTSTAVPAFAIRESINVTDGDLIFAVQDSTPTNVFTVNEQGLTSMSGGMAVGGGTTVLKVLTATAVIDFATATTTCTESGNITVTGAATNDSCFMGPPTTGGSTNASYTCYVSAADTVKARHCAAGTADDPASATYRVTVFKY